MMTKSATALAVLALAAGLTPAPQARAAAAPAAATNIIPIEPAANETLADKLLREDEERILYKLEHKQALTNYEMGRHAEYLSKSRAGSPVSTGASGSSKKPGGAAADGSTGGTASARPGAASSGASTSSQAPIKEIPPEQLGKMVSMSTEPLPGEVKGVIPPKAVVRYYVTVLQCDKMRQQVRAQNIQRNLTYIEQHKRAMKESMNPDIEMLTASIKRLTEENAKTRQYDQRCAVLASKAAGGAAPDQPAKPDPKQDPKKTDQPSKTQAPKAEPPKAEPKKPANNAKDGAIEMGRLEENVELAEREHQRTKSAESKKRLDDAKEELAAYKTRRAKARDEYAMLKGDIDQARKDYKAEPTPFNQEKIKRAEEAYVRFGNQNAQYLPDPYASTQTPEPLAPGQQRANDRQGGMVPLAPAEPGKTIGESTFGKDGNDRRMTNDARNLPEYQESTPAERRAKDQDTANRSSEMPRLKNPGDKGGTIADETFGKDAAPGRTVVVKTPPLKKTP